MKARVQDTLPHLVDHVLPEVPAPFEQRLELGRLGIAHQCWHPQKAAADPGRSTRIATLATVNR
jgi:hypothetical protein